MSSNVAQEPDYETELKQEIERLDRELVPKFREQIEQYRDAAGLTGDASDPHNAKKTANYCVRLLEQVRLKHHYLGGPPSDCDTDQATEDKYTQFSVLKLQLMQVVERLCDTAESFAFSRISAVTSIPFRQLLQSGCDLNGFAAVLPFAQQIGGIARGMIETESNGAAADIAIKQRASEAYREQRHRDNVAVLFAQIGRDQQQRAAEREKDPAWQRLYGDPEYQQAKREFDALRLDPKNPFEAAFKNPRAMEILHRIQEMKVNYSVDMRSARERAETPEHFVEWLERDAFTLWFMNEDAQFLHEVLAKAIDLARRANMSPPPEPPAGANVTQALGQLYLLKLAAWAKTSTVLAPHGQTTDILIRGLPKKIVPPANLAGSDVKRPNWSPIGGAMKLCRLEGGEQQYKLANKIIADYRVPIRTIGNGKGVRWVEVAPWIAALESAGRLLQSTENDDVPPLSLPPAKPEKISELPIAEVLAQNSEAARKRVHVRHGKIS